MDLNLNLSTEAFASFVACIIIGIIAKIVISWLDH